MQESMVKFMKCLLTNYVGYFKKRYQRVGHLFQGSYKAVLVDKDPYLLHLSRYIHCNPIELSGTSITEWSYSSYGDYMQQRHTKWVHPEYILEAFACVKSKSTDDITSYESFIDEALHAKNRALYEHISDFLIDNAPHARIIPVQG